MKIAGAAVCWSPIQHLNLKYILEIFIVLSIPIGVISVNYIFIQIKNRTPKSPYGRIRKRGGPIGSAHSCIRIRSRDPFISHHYNCAHVPQPTAAERLYGPAKAKRRTATYEYMLNERFQWNRINTPRRMHAQPTPRQHPRPRIKTYIHIST